MKILVTGAWKCTEEQLNTIKNLGHSVTFMQNETDPLPCAYEEVDGVICNGLFLSHSIEKFKSLKFIQLTSAGFDRVPMDYVTAHGIEIYNAKGVYSIPMAEFAICGVLDLYKKSRYFYDNQKIKKWEKHYGLLELFGKKVCIIGVGNVGTECAKRFKAFGCLVYGVDINVRNDDTFEKIYPIEEIETVISDIDIVVLTLPLTEKTKGLFNKNLFEKMKYNSVFINIARGAIVEENSLIEALKTKLLGAVLDVFEEEPLSKESELWGLENVILTPHNSFVGENNGKRLYGLIIKNMGALK